MTLSGFAVNDNSSVQECTWRFYCTMLAAMMKMVKKMSVQMANYIAAMGIRKHNCVITCERNKPNPAANYNRLCLFQNLKRGEQ